MCLDYQGHHQCKRNLIRFCILQNNRRLVSHFHHHINVNHSQDRLHKSHCINLTWLDTAFLGYCCIAGKDLQRKLYRLCIQYNLKLFHSAYTYCKRSRTLNKSCFPHLSKNHQNIWVLSKLIHQPWCIQPCIHNTLRMKIQSKTHSIHCKLYMTMSPHHSKCC